MAALDRPTEAASGQRFAAQEVTTAGLEDPLATATGAVDEVPSPASRPRLKETDLHFPSPIIMWSRAGIPSARPGSDC